MPSDLASVWYGTPPHRGGDQCTDEAKKDEKRRRGGGEHGGVGEATALMDDGRTRERGDGRGYTFIFIFFSSSSHHHHHHQGGGRGGGDGGFSVGHHRRVSSSPSPPRFARDDAFFCFFFFFWGGCVDSRRTRGAGIAASASASLGCRWWGVDGMEESMDGERVIVGHPSSTHNGRMA